MKSTTRPSLSYQDKIGYSKVNLNGCFHLFRSGVSQEIFYLSMNITLHSFAEVLPIIILWNSAKHGCMYLKEQVDYICLLPSHLLAKMQNPFRLCGLKCFERKVQSAWTKKMWSVFDCRVYADVLPCCSSSMRYQLGIILSSSFLRFDVICPFVI